MTGHGSRSPSPDSSEPEGGLRPVAGEGDAALRGGAVVADSAAALPTSWLTDYTTAGGFALVDMPVLIGGQLHTEDESDTLSSLVVALAEGKPVTTSRPAPGQLRAAYRRFEAEGFDAVVSVHLSGELSGTVGAARIARQEIGIPVRIVDTQS
ncbi:DegV family protein, partial [Kocuria sp.]|uniref:DegV family protein n=1 Tax=Kocuria sp. TaxID=1871328 RepID=UPI00264714C4